MSTETIDNIYNPKLNRELLKLHEVLFDNANDIILYLAEDGRILAANKMAIKKYGYTYDELSSMYVRDLRHTSMDSSYIDQMTLSEHIGIVFEGIHVKKDGDTFPIEVSSKTIELHDEKFRIHIIRDTTDRRKIENKIIYLASHDPLTNVANRASIISQLDNAIEISKITGNKLAFIIFDLDKFKLINDTYGHPVGDKVLQYVAQMVQKSLRVDDVIGRFGGDEFVIIQRKIQSKDDVIALINRIFGIFEYPAIIDNNSIKINISVGICLFSEGIIREQLISQADSAMYEAKKRQGCTFEFCGYANSK